MKLSVNVKYMCVQGLFWTLFCIGLGYVSLYLLSEGVSNSGIGMTNACFGLISAVLQPVFGRLCDKREDISWKKTIIVCAILFIAVCTVMLCVTGIKILSVILIGGLTMLANLILPFINSALFYYKSYGEYINFGVARGIGSGMYALVAYIVGNAAATYGPKAVPIAGIIVGILFMMAVISLPYNPEYDNSSGLGENRDTDALTDSSRSDENTVDGSEGSVKGISEASDKSFIRKYPAFIVMICGFILLLTTHNITCNFMLQIIQNIGGNSSNLGTAMAIQAIVEVPVLFCFGFLLKKFSANTLMGVAAVGYLIKAILYYLAGTVTAIYAIQFAQMISFAIFASASVYYTGTMVSEKDRTTGQALMSSCIVIGNIIGSLAGGLIIDALGVKPMLAVNVAFALMGTAVAFIAVIKSRKQEIE